MVDSKTIKTLSGHITERLRNDIVNGVIAPGTKLSEPKLADQFKVSRGPLREAICRLEIMKLVTHVPNEGVRVVSLALSAVLEIYEVREALEGMAAGLAAIHRSSNDIDKLYHLLEMHEEYINSNAGNYMTLEGDLDFHYQIIQACGNKFLINQLCGELYHLIRMYRNQASDVVSRSGSALKEHQQLIYTIEQQDKELAEMTMRRHIRQARNTIENRIGEEIGNELSR